MKIKNKNKQSLKLKTSVYLTGLFLIIGLFSLNIFSQQPTEIIEIHDTEAPKVAPKVAPVVVEEAPDGVDQSSDELMKQEQANTKLYQELYTGKGKKLDSGPAFDHEAAIKSIALQLNKDIKPKDIKKMKIHTAVELALKPFQLMSEEDLLKQVLENTKDSKVHPYFIKYPRLVKFAIKLIKDPKAIPYASRILEDRDKLVKYSAIMIFTILFGFLLKKVISTSTELWTRIIFFYFVRALIMFVIRISITIYFFGDDLTPLFNAFVNYFIA